MAHKHEYETVGRHSVSKEVEELGIRAAEVRRCKGCGEEVVFLQAGDSWVPLYDETSRSEKDILLA